MYAEKVQVKVFSSGAPDVGGYLPVFHRWIRDSVLNELMIDVVDYSHVANGPEVVLIGHASDYALDRGGGKIGLLYSSKREPETDEGAFVSALRRALRACALLEKEAGPKVPLKFAADTLLVRILDRLSAPNDDQTFARVEPALRSALARAYGDATLSLKRVGAPREAFSVEVSAKGAADIGSLLARLG
jgi:hypothetical protein